MNDWYNDDWPYRAGLTVAASELSAEDLNDFPLFVSVQSPALRDEAHGGHVAQADGEDMLFVLPETQAKLDHQIIQWRPDTGELTCRVRVPVLSGDADTVLHLYYGNPACQPQSNPRGVWPPHCLTALHKTEAMVERAATDDPGAGGAISVEAWITSDRPSAEAMQVIASKWRSLSTFDTFDAYDAGMTSGLDTTGFLGAVFDGRYVYFSPQHDARGRHGKALRYDTHQPFNDPAAWEGYDASHTSGLETQGYYGAVFDGRYVYYVPRRTNETYHTRVLRYDTQGAFVDAASWKAYDVGHVISYQSGALDGRYVYFCPGYEADDNRPSGKVMRYDTLGDFDDPASYVLYDAAGTSGVDTRCYDGAVFDGTYIYFAPLDTPSPLRYDTRGAFDDPASWQGYDAARLRMTRCVGAIFDGRYVYYVPYGKNPGVVRFDTAGDFRNDADWSVYEIARTKGLDTRGYDGAAFDGRYIIFIPFWNEETDFHCAFLRYDTLKSFVDPESWDTCDAGATSGLKTAGYNAAAFDGRYVYCAPWHDGTGYVADGRIAGHGRVLRYDTAGDNGAFKLLYADCGHNGGLCGAGPGPRFVVNTDNGPVSVAANRIIPPGRHHFAGVYDGRRIQLFVDGELAGEQEASGVIRNNDVPFAVGQLADGAAPFNGTIEEVRVLNAPLDAAWIAAEYRSRRSPGAVCQMHEEEARP